MVRVVEELSMSAWPSLQTMLYDGWVLRFADGYTKRANSINPLYPFGKDVHEKVQTCERIYQDKGLDVVFKMTSAVYPENLDEVLAAKGYTADSRTSVQVLDLGSRDKLPTQDAHLAGSLSGEWLSAFCEMSGIDRQREPTLRRMLNNIVPAKCFASIRYDDKVIACSLGVLQGEFIGLFDIVTGSDFRGRGYGTQLVLGILAWGKEHGAQTAYLQVMLNNAPALRLYSKLGFDEIYQYWYRIKR
jgi:ribosomal protein S18 acetylase RimI-like enzyme